MNRASDSLNLIPAQKFRTDLKAGHETSSRSAFGVPIARDLRGVFFVENGIENRLMRQSRREFAITATSDQIHFIRSNKAKESYRFVHWFFYFIFVFLFSRHSGFVVSLTSMPRVSTCAQKSLHIRSLSSPVQ